MYITYTVYCNYDLKYIRPWGTWSSQVVFKAFVILDRYHFERNCNS